jgi:hypothetical protein
MKSVRTMCFKGEDHGRDPQDNHHPRNDFLGAWCRGKPTNNTGVGMAVIRNPFAGQFVEDLRPLFETGAMLGERLMPHLVKMLDGLAVSYGKGAIVGVAGEMEHGGACVHPMLGKPMRAAIGGGRAVIGSNVKVAAAGALLDVPLGHKDDSWSVPHFATITVSVADAPRPDEILVAMAIADGGRLRNRCGTDPIR